MKIAIYPGSFDPITNGHLDIIERSSRVFDKLIVAIIKNYSKVPLFTIEERVNLVKKSTRHIDNVEVDHFEGLLINYVERRKAVTIVKGLRAISDFENEFQMALMNRKLNQNIETVFMMTSSEYSFLSSSMVKEVASLGGSIDGLVPDIIMEDIKNKFC